VENTGLVSAWPGVSLNVAQRVDAVSYAGNGINAQTGTTYTLVLTDAGKNVTCSNASSVTVTIPTNASVAFPTGTVISITNLGAGTVTVAAGGGVTLNGTTLTIAQYGRSSIMKTATDTWVLTSGGGSPKASVSSTTGSPTVVTVSGKTYYQFTGTGSATLTAGTLRVMVQAGGGGGNSSRAGGAGGQITQTLTVTAGTYTVTVGAGGDSTSQGTASQFHSLYSVGGGNNSYTAAPGGVGFGGSGSATASPTGKNVPSQGNIGASGPGGGGGAGGAATGTTPSGVGGVGIAFADGNTYGVGGSEGSGGAGTTNRGNGGQGSSPYAGGSGMVVLEIG
jgi:hypothetical protein